MQSRSPRGSTTELPAAGRADRAPGLPGGARPIELLALAALLALVVVAATWAARPQLHVEADSAGAPRYLVGFWPVEQNATESFRWSGVDSALSLFGFEQRAPALVRLRLTSVREPGQPPAQLTIGGSQQTPFAVSSSSWRIYQALLPALPRGDQAPSVSLQTSHSVFKNDPRDLGVVLSRLDAVQLPLSPLDRLPDAGRLVFLVLLGLLVFLALRGALARARLAWAVTLALTLALGAGLVAAPGQVAYWLPNLWLALLVACCAIVAPWLVRALRRSSGDGSALPALGLLAVVGAQLLLPLQQPWSSAIGWPLILGGGVALVAARPRLPVAQTQPGRRAVMLALLGATLVALALRLVALDGLPLGMWRDEARHGLLALRILRDPTYRPVYVPVVADIPALLFYLAAAPIGLFGNHPWTVRLAPALAGALTPLVAYWLARPLFGTRAALLSAALLAASVWHVALSRLAFAATLGPPLTMLAIGLAWRALDGGPPRRRLAQAGLAGACGGLAVYAYHPSRLTPLVVALAVALALGWDWRAWRAAGPRLAVAGALGLLVLWPLIGYARENPDGFGRRLDQTFIFGGESGAGHAPAALIEDNARLMLGMWNERGDSNARHNLSGAPMLDPITGVAFVVGASLALGQLRDRRFQLLLTWLGVMLIPGLLSGQAPHAVRTVEAIAPSIVLAGLGAEAIAAWAQADLRRVSAALPQGATAVLLACVLALNGWRYFVAWPATPQSYEEFYVADTHVGEAARRLAALPEIAGQGYSILVAPDREKGDDDVLRYLAASMDIGVCVRDRPAQPVGERVLLVVSGDPAVVKQPACSELRAQLPLLGTGPRSPVSGLAEYAIYGRGPAAAVVAGMALTR